jgi:transcriptional regulator with XRE-family HTH domain
MARKNRTHGTEDTPGGDDENNPSANVVPLTPKHLRKQDFGRRLYSLMMGKGWSQADLARASGLQRASISSYINGQSFPDPKNLQRLAVALGVDAERLLPNQFQQRVDTEQGGVVLTISTEDPSRAWLRVDREVPAELGAQIVVMLTKKRDAAD